MSRIWDISQKLRAGLPVWPGDTQFSHTPTWEMRDGSPVNVSALTLSTHSGTHADAPLHYDPAGLDSAASDLEPYLGKCLVVDARGSGAAIAIGTVPGLDGIERVLFRTYESFPHDMWDENFTAIEPETIAWLAAQGVKLVGIDTPSLDPQDSKTMDAHKAVLAADMRILEGLVLDDVPPGLYELIALPLPIAGADASPVRAILRELP
ncbi:arylformamidase [Pontixanthobacter gangjinensis]|uniref:Kynurenine formamidase n=1 Tax=Pontixanthobacter gangjinensis TaxID=1028742 RepID=A0A6I4SIM6_9SPHN|nr:arylformamidase [Pontixanthobacter gangjinensis]MXO55483.1 arylformamidase [Pontixanthobacter gangjinensis]